MNATTCGLLYLCEDAFLNGKRFQDLSIKYVTPFINSAGETDRHICMKDVARLYPDTGEVIRVNGFSDEEVGTALAIMRGLTRAALSGLTDLSPNLDRILTDPEEPRLLTLEPIY